MALIPPDAGIRMRMQMEANLLQPTAPVGGIPSDLPELRQGQTFTAHIQEVLPENTYRALVAGKQLTLQLPEGAKAGDSLELVVIDRTPKVIVAKLSSESAGAGAAEPYPYATLSRTGQMIGQLLLPEGEQPRPAPLNRGQPLLAEPPTHAGELAPALQKAVAQSGLFYESHQAQWAAGRLPTEQLLQEPQGQRSSTGTLLLHGLAPPPRGVEDPATTTQRTSVPANLFQATAGGDEPIDTLTSRQAALPSASALPTVPDELRPIVQQQLDAAVTQRLVWHGEVWPQQAMDWEIVREREGDTATSEDEGASWRTTLRLDTPRLGHVNASLRLTATGLHIAVTTPIDASAANLRNESPALAASLAAAGITLLSFQVRHEPR